MDEIDVQLKDTDGRPLPAEGRYDRLELIPWWDRDRMAAARVMVVGAGALGNEIIKNLALLGVGRILVIDLDEIELSNLTRSVLFRESDIGEAKATVAARRAMEINPDIQVADLVGNVVTDLGLGVFADCDVVIGGLDNGEARLAINQACWKVGRPFVDGAIEVFFGVARVFVPPDSACFECTMNETDLLLLNKRKSCALLSRDEMISGKVPTTPTVSSVIAGIEVSEAMKLLHARRDLPVLAGAGFFFNGLTHDSYVVRYDRKEDCISHDTYADIQRIDKSIGLTTLGEMLALGRDELHPEAVLDLEKEIVVRLTCDPCGHEVQIRRVLGHVKPDEAKCPKCGKVMRPELTHTIDADCGFLECTFGDLGLPPYDVVTARYGLDRRHYLFAADRRAALGILA